MKQASARPEFNGSEKTAPRSPTVKSKNDYITELETFIKRLGAKRDALDKESDVSFGQKKVNLVRSFCETNAQITAVKECLRLAKKTI